MESVPNTHSKTKSSQTKKIEIGRINNSNTVVLEDEAVIG